MIRKRSLLFIIVIFFFFGIGGCVAIYYGSEYKCDGDILRWWDINGLICSSFSYTCRWSEEFQSYTCVPGSELKYETRCEGDILWVFNEDVDCPWVNYTCGWSEEYQAHICLPKDKLKNNPPPENSSVGYEGKCDKNVLIYREFNGQIVKVDCSLLDYICGWNKEYKYYTCLPKEYECKGDTLVQYEVSGIFPSPESSVGEIDCSIIDHTCGWSEMYQAYTCLPKTQSTFSTYSYRCDGDILEEYSSGEYYPIVHSRIDCSEVNYVCAWSEEYQSFTCLPKLLFVLQNKG